jgi:hypothetical protein
LTRLHVALDSLEEAPKADKRACWLQVQIRFMLAEAPSHHVTCPLTVNPPTEAQLTPFKLDFVPENVSVPITVSVRGTRDWTAELDRKYVKVPHVLPGLALEMTEFVCHICAGTCRRYNVTVGKCISRDPRFDGMGFPQAPGLTQMALWNEEVAFPRITAVVPSDVRPSGTLITVHGKRFTPQARMFVAGYVLADPATYPFELSSRRRAPKRWLWALNTALERVQPISVADLARMGVVYTGDNASFDDLRYNKTLCSIMAEHGLLKSTASFAVEVQDFDEAPNEELSDLLGFRWWGAASPRDSAAASAQDFGAEAGIESTSFVTPCMPSSTAEVR